MKSEGARAAGRGHSQACPIDRLLLFILFSRLRQRGPEDAAAVSRGGRRVAAETLSP